jgi:O-acetyl-ADP-ribose deacetylase
MQNRIEVIKGDITAIAVQVIVNAANSSLMGGGGVDGAIHGGCKTGEAVITTAGRLPAQYVIHTVGPVWRGGRHNEEQLLANCYTNSLQLALDYACSTVAFPNISTGVYGFPKHLAAAIAASEVKAFLNEKAFFEKVMFVCFDEENFQLMQQQLVSDFS